MIFLDCSTPAETQILSGSRIPREHLAVHSLVVAADRAVRATRRSASRLRSRADALDARDSAQGHYRDVQQALLSRHGAEILARHPEWRADAAAAARQSVARADAAIPEVNGTVAVHRLMEEARAPLHWQEMGRVSNSIPMGAMQYQIVMARDTGEAQIYVGGDGDIQNVARDADFANLPVIYMLARASYGLIEASQWAYGGLGDLEGQLRNAATRAVDHTTNRLVFEGQASPYALGLKNMPGIIKDVTGLSIASATAAQLYSALVQLVRRPVEESRQAFSPDRLCVAPEIMTAMKEKTMAGSDRTVYEQFAMTFPNVKIVEWQELSDFVSAGIHAMYAGVSSGEGAPTIEASPVLHVPVFTMGMQTELWAYRSYGSLLHPNAVSARLATLTD